MSEELKEKQLLSGSEIMLRCLVAEGVDTIFGYPGGQIMPVYDKLYDHHDDLRHILVRHEQGAIHAAQGYARATGRTGVVTVTSGPGATNVITGVADAMIDSTPVVVISGQVATHLLGTDAFQETDVIGLTSPITKWCYQIRRVEDIQWAVARAFHIASTGRPGPVVLDFTATAQRGMAEFSYSRCESIRSYVPVPEVSEESLDEAARMIDEARKPFLVFGQGIILSGAEKELAEFLEKSGMPCGSTLLGLSALPDGFPLYQGMVGMHGNVAPNIMTQECDLLVAVGMRFDDRVTGNTATYATQAKKIHIDIDASEIGKLIPVDLGVLGDAREVLSKLSARIRRQAREDWGLTSTICNAVERHRVIDPEIHPEEGHIHMGEVIDMVAEVSRNSAIIVTDVGQNQMLGARYSRFNQTRSMITSGGLGTMGFGLPAAIGAKIGRPDRQVCLFVGDGGLQMTVQELGTIMQERTGVKIILLNNNWLGNVRMWQELFYDERYSYTRLMNPDFGQIAAAYGIRSRVVEKREDLRAVVEEMLSDDDAYILDAHVLEMGMVFPMIPPGKSVNEIMLNNEDWFDYGE